MKNKTDTEEVVPLTVAPKSQVIRLGAGEVEKLGQLSKRFGVPQAQLIRWALDALFTKVEQSDGKLTLPLSFDEPEPT